MSYITQKKLAELVDCNRKTFYRHIRDKKLKAEKVGNQNKIPQDAAWIWYKKYWAHKKEQSEIKKVEEALCSENSILFDEDVIQKDEVNEAFHSNDDSKDTEVINSDPVFVAGLEEMGLDIEDNGIYSYDQDMRHKKANFSRVTFKYTIIKNDNRVRIYRFDDESIKLRPQDLTGKSSFERALTGQSGFYLDLSTVEFSKFKILLIEMDNSKIVEKMNGVGMVAKGLWNLGEKVIINGKQQDFKSLIWKNDTGYELEQTDQIKISENRLSLDEIADYFFQLYGKNAILILGFASMTLFFKQYLSRMKHFPILYLRGASSSGKSCMAELICKLFGMEESLFIVNWAGNSTSIGGEMKAVRLHNLPIVFNEIEENQFNSIKSRYDGHGSCKHSKQSRSSLSERSVNSSTIVTTVVEPHDKQIISRCVFIDLDEIEKKKSLFDRARSVSDNFSSFILEVIGSMNYKELMDHIEKFSNELGDSAIPRILDNYSLIGGSFMAFKSICEDTSDLPSDQEVIQFIRKQMSQAESLLNPVPSFLYELERLYVNGKAKSFITQDEKFIYFNFEGVWSKISPAYKNKYFPFMSKRNLQEELKQSEFMVIASKDLSLKSKHKGGQPVTQYPKKIKSTTRRCFVLKKAIMPGYFK